ncbi:MAG: hypothetical protein ABI254_05600, partial [Chthoniobacterales bacterium]
MVIRTMERMICKQCGVEFEHLPFFFGGREMFSLPTCDACHESGFADYQKQSDEHTRAQRELAWRAICPPLYRETDPQRLPASFLHAIGEWQPGPKGVAFIGTAGMGKTRAAFLLLRRQFDAGMRCEAISSTRFATLISDLYTAEDKHAA